MNRITSSTKFDDRRVDFLTGRKVSPAVEDRKVCDCCRQRIVKGFFTNLGTVGDDCHDIIRTAGSMGAEAYERHVKLCPVKPAVAQFLKQQVYQ